MLENLVHVLHQVAAIVWLGGVLALNILQLRLGGDRAARGPVLRMVDLYGRSVVAPAAVVTLLTGVVLVGQLGVPWTTLWVVWGLAGIVLSFVLGATVIRTNNAELRRLADDGPDDDREWRARQRRAAVLYGINLLVLLSVVWAMVLQPTG